MYSLFIDTTQNICHFALLKDQKIIKFASYPTMNNMTDLAVEKIDLLLKNLQVEKANIKNIYCVTGPGSFTGCRVGIIITKAWSLTFKIQIFFINSLLLQLPLGTGISIIDAKSQKKYIAVYDNYQVLLHPQIIDTSALDTVTKNFLNYHMYNDYQKTDIFINLPMAIKYFEKASSPKQLIPLYLKRPI